MKYYTLPPSKKLGSLVRFFWVFESGELNKPYIYRSMADSCAELIFHYKGSFDELAADGHRTGSFLSGIHSQTQSYHRFVTNERFGIFGVYLYPFAVRRLFNLSPHELTNRMPDLHSALGKIGKELEERMMRAPNNKVRHRILTGFLESRLHDTNDYNHPTVSAIRQIIHSGNGYMVSDLANHYNLSERQFQRKFKEYSGFSPKKFMRIVRFSDACNYYKEAGNKLLTEIAYECRYYDQSHFIKDFKTFSGYHPTEYFSGDAEGIEWRDS
jgi:AraC-like DNA-binding protein